MTVQWLHWQRILKDDAMAMLAEDIGRAWSSLIDD